MTEGYDCQACGACGADRTGSLAYVRLLRGEVGPLRRLGLPVIGTREGNYLGTKVAEDGQRVCAGQPVLTDGPASRGGRPFLRGRAPRYGRTCRRRMARAGPGPRA
jgi:hypothetical protein